MRTLIAIKADLVAAHRKGDWDWACELSQERNKARKQERGRCIDCGAVICRQSTRCNMHEKLHRNYKRSLPFWLFLMCCFSAIANPPTNPPPALVCGWTHSPSTNVVAYRVYWGPSTRLYTNSIQVAYVTSATITNVFRNTWYWVSATAVDDNGLESDYSNEVQVRVPNKPNPPTAFSASPQ